MPCGRPGSMRSYVVVDGLTRTLSNLTEPLRWRVDTLLPPHAVEQIAQVIVPESSCPCSQTSLPQSSVPVSA